MKLHDKKVKAWLKKYGGLSPETEQKINRLVAKLEKEQLLTNYTAKKATQAKYRDNAKFIREYRAKKYEVDSTKDGFKYNGKIYKSLSAIATEITGTRWNCKRFFGVREPKYSAEKKLTKCQVFREETRTAAVSRRSSAKLNDGDVGLQAQSAETHRSVAS